ncbi:MAG: LysR family transcriptional regulator [Pseudorhodoplanes sp.]
MELAWLEDFLALADCLNFSRAAERRNMTQPAFSRRVRALETWVGVPLFDRGSHRIVLTPAGTQFLPVAHDVIRRLYQVRQEALDAQALASSLRFASTFALSLTFFPAWMRKLEETMTLGSVELIADNMQACESLMLGGQAQFLLCHCHPAASHKLDPQDFVSALIGRDVLIPLTAVSSNGAPQFTLPGAAEEPVPHLAYSERSGIGRILAAVRAREAPPVWLKPVFTSHLAIALKTMAGHGRGVAWIPKSLASDDLAPKGGLVRAGDERWDIAVEVRLFRPRARQSERAEDFWADLTRRAEPI